jgi:hypothetical protein
MDTKRTLSLSFHAQGVPFFIISCACVTVAEKIITAGHVYVTAWTRVWLGGRYGSFSFFFYYCKNIIFLKYKLNFLKIKNIFFLLKETTVSPTKHMEYAVLV